MEWLVFLIPLFALIIVGEPPPDNPPPMAPPEIVNVGGAFDPFQTPSLAGALSAGALTDLSAFPKFNVTDINFFVRSTVDDIRLVFRACDQRACIRSFEAEIGQRLREKFKEEDEEIVLMLLVAAAG